jgi:hypothetical protein
MASTWGRLEREGGSMPIPGRPPCEGRRWRPHESLNDYPRPKDLAAYLASFQARPLADRHAQAS